MALIDSVKDSTLSLKGETPELRAGALKENDLHSTGQAGSDHVHRDASKPISILATQSAQLQESKFNQSAPYANPEK